MNYKDRFQSVGRQLFESDSQNLTDFWLESFNGYYGILELKGIQGFVASKNRESVAYLEIYPTPEDVREKHPKLYGDAPAETEAMDAWIQRLSSFGLDAHYLEIAELENFDFRNIKFSTITNDPYLMFLRSSDILYKISINAKGAVSGLSVYSVEAVLLEDGSESARALLANPDDAALLKYFE
jgi:hypothetical protein